MLDAAAAANIISAAGCPCVFSFLCASDQTPSRADVQEHRYEIFGKRETTMRSNIIRFALIVPVVVTCMAAAIDTAYGQFVPAPEPPRTLRGHVVDLRLPCGRRVEIRAVYIYAGWYSGSTRRAPIVITGRYIIYVDGHRQLRGHFSTLRTIRRGEHRIGVRRAYWIPSGRRCWAVANFKNALTVQRKVNPGPDRYHRYTSSTDVWGVRRLEIIRGTRTVLSLRLRFGILRRRP